MTEEKARPPTDSEVVRLARKLMPYINHLGRDGEVICDDLRAALGEARGTASASEHRVGFVDVVFDGPPEHEAGRFVEVEDADGHGVNAGVWIDRGNGMWALRIGTAPASRSQNSEQGALRASLDDLRAKVFAAALEVGQGDRHCTCNSPMAKGCVTCDALDVLEAAVVAFDKATADASGDALKAPFPSSESSPPAPDLLRENARLREQLSEAKGHLDDANENVRNNEALTAELTRARAAHLENAELLAKANARVAQLEIAIRWAQGEIAAPGVGWFGTQEDAAGPIRRPYWWRGPLRKLTATIPPEDQSVDRKGTAAQPPLSSDSAADPGRVEGKKP